MGLDLLIQKITPLFNNYKENNNQFNGTQAIELMWEVGDLLNNYIVENMIAPHSLFRTIYGNAEGTTNIVRRSYISREFQTRSHRIRRIFRQKEEINNLFPNLKKYIPFREAMPFFDDGKYKLKGKEREDLIVLLNSNLNPAKIVIEIKKLQNIYIGIKNPRTQRLHELEAEKQTFIDFYNSIFGLIKEKNYETVKLKLNGIDLEFLKILSKNVSALSQEGLKSYEFEIPQEFEDNCKKFCEMVKHFTLQKNPKERRRFRRLIPPGRIVRLADMLYALVSQQLFENFK